MIKIQNKNEKNAGIVVVLFWLFEFLYFEFVSDFVLRISKFSDAGDRGVK